jgi:hypothetical protein
MERQDDLRRCWGSQQKIILFPANHFLWSIYVVERQRNSGGVHNFEDRVHGNVTLLMKTDEADLKVVYSYQSKKISAVGAAPSRDYTRTVYRRHPDSGPAKQRKKKDWTRNPATRWHPAHGVSSNSRARIYKPPNAPWLIHPHILLSSPWLGSHVLESCSRVRGNPRASGPTWPLRAHRGNPRAPGPLALGRPGRPPQWA